jgi:hypothetical protein
MILLHNLLSAFIKHSLLALQLKHDGSGMPTELPGAFLIAALYTALTLVNSHLSEGITLTTTLMVMFIAQCYVLFLRNKLIGLIMLISIIMNAFTTILSVSTGIPMENLGLLIVSEYILVAAAVINVIKNETTAI